MITDFLQFRFQNLIFVHNNVLKDYLTPSFNSLYNCFIRSSNLSCPSGAISGSLNHSTTEPSPVLCPVPTALIPVLILIGRIKRASGISFPFKHRAVLVIICDIFSEIHGLFLFGDHVVFVIVTGDGSRPLKKSPVN